MTRMYDNIVDNRLQHAINQIAREDGQSISVASKAKSLEKFGHSNVVDSSKFHEIWGLSDAGGPSRLATNGLTEIISDQGADTESIYMEGFTISGTDLTFITQTITLTGTTGALLTSATQTDGSAGVALSRCTRLINRGTSVLTGNVYVWDGSTDTTPGTPDDLTTVGAHILAGGQQTEQASTSTSSTDYFLVTEIDASVNRVQAAAVDVDFEIRDVSTGGVWLPVHVEVGLHTTGGTTFHSSLDPVLTIRPNHDIRMIASSSSATDTAVSASFAGYLAEFV